MKKAIKVMYIAAFISMSMACKKDRRANNTDSHLNNPMMTVLHQTLEKIRPLSLTKDPDQDFAMMMQLHHQGAIDMANLETKNGNDAAIKQIAQNIIQRQQAEAASMLVFLNGHGPDINVPDFDTKATAAMEAMGKNADSQTLKGTTDYDFSALMIQHHQAAITIANLEVQYGDEPQMRNLAKAIISDHQKEIMDLQAWLKNK